MNAADCAEHNANADTYADTTTAGGAA